MGHRFTQRMSQYECGRSLPPLQTALLLEIALGAKLSEIYVDLYADLTAQLLARADRMPHHVRRQVFGRLLGKETNGQHPGPRGGLA